MTVFDLIAFGVVVWSALAGSKHGAVAELVGLFAAALAAMATIAALPATAAIARHILHAGWLSAVAAAGATFVVVFNKATPDGMKPGWITDAAAYPLATDAGLALQTVLPKSLDLSGGFGDRLSRSIRDESVQPDGEQAPANEDAPPAETSPSDAVSANPHEAPSSERAKPAHNGYTKHARDSVDALVERSK